MATGSESADTCMSGMHQNKRKLQKKFLEEMWGQKKQQFHGKLYNAVYKHFYDDTWMRWHLHECPGTNQKKA